MDKISVIIPVYNAEKFLNKCLDSVINQTYKNIELLVINDGSKDSSLKIINEYKEKYDKIIKVIDQKNQGEGKARNNGLKIATGDFITFLDSDDWYKEDYLEILHKEIGKNDIVVSGFQRYNKNYEYEYEKIPENNPWSKFKYCSVAGKMYRASFMKKNKLKFKNYKVGEDVYFSLNAYSLTEKIQVAEYSGYCNYENVGSITNVKQYDPEKSLMIVLRDVDRDINTDNFSINDITFFYLKNIIVEFILTKDYLSSKELNNNFKKNMSWLESVLKKKNHKLRVIKCEYESSKINLAVKIFVVFYKIRLSYLLIAILKRLKLSII